MSTRFTDPLLRYLHVPTLPTTGLLLCSSPEQFPVFVLYTTTTTTTTMLQLPWKAWFWSEYANWSLEA